MASKFAGRVTIIGREKKNNWLIKLEGEDFGIRRVKEKKFRVSF